MFGLTPVRPSGMQKGNVYGDFYNAIDNFFNDDFFGRSITRSSTFPMDIKEDEKSYTIEAELPGFTKEEITLDYNKDTLYIAAEHKQIKEEANQERKEEVKQEEVEGSKENNEGQKEEVTQEVTQVVDQKTIQGLDQQGKQERYLHRERKNISMQRGIYLKNINKEAIEAKLENGILTVIVPKLVEPENSFKITIQ